jgi:pantoate kinase
LAKRRTSRTIYVPCGVSSFFEICDQDSVGNPISDLLRVGARGGGFIIERGSRTVVSALEGGKEDSVFINGVRVRNASTTLRVVRLMRRKYGFGPVSISHNIAPPIGAGFGTSGSGALGTAAAVSDVFDLKLPLSKITAFAHTAEILSITGLGTVISLASGAGGLGLVTEPGCYSIGKVDAIVDNYSNYSLICVTFGSIEKSSVLKDEQKRRMVNKFGRTTLQRVLRDPTAKTLLHESRQFAEKTGLASKDLLKLADQAVRRGAIGATQNMIGNAVHCLALREDEKKILKWLHDLVPGQLIFRTPLYQGGVKVLDD